jgi:hypothetical protein
MIALFPVVPSLCSQYVPSLSLFFSWLFPVFPVKKTHARVCGMCMGGERGYEYVYGFNRNRLGTLGTNVQLFVESIAYKKNETGNRLGTDWEHWEQTGNRLGPTGAWLWRFHCRPTVR